MLAWFFLCEVIHMARGTISLTSSTYFHLLVILNSCLLFQGFAQSLLGRGLILLIMIMNAALVVLLIRYTRISEGPMYFSTTAVVISEFQKLV